MERAGVALESTDYIAAERLAQEALELAQRSRDYSRMARIVMPLEEARRQKRLIAADAGVRGVLTEPPGEGWPGGPGVWIVAPPLVGADARELRRIADEQGVCSLILTREPETRAGEWPIVVIGRTTVRAYVEPPRNKLSKSSPKSAAKKAPTAGAGAEAVPDAAWSLAAAEALGDAAIETVDPAKPASVRVDLLVDLVATLRDHDKLHQALAAACLEAMRDEPAEA